jgi:hypothetical protein
VKICDLSSAQKLDGSIAWPKMGHMQAAPKLELDESKISEPLSWEEICARFPEGWVCLVEIDWVALNSFEFRTARVLCHSESGDETLQEAKSWWWRFDEIGHFFTGDMSGNRAFWEHTGELIDNREYAG